MTLVGKSHTGMHLSETKIWEEIKKGFTHFANDDLGVAKITPCFENSKAAVFHDLVNGVGAGTTELHVARLFLHKKTIAKFMLLNFKLPAYLKLGESKMNRNSRSKTLAKRLFRKLSITTTTAY